MTRASGLQDGPNSAARATLPFPRFAPCTAQELRAHDRTDESAPCVSGTPTRARARGKSPAIVARCELSDTAAAERATRSHPSAPRAHRAHSDKRVSRNATFDNLNPADTHPKQAHSHGAPQDARRCLLQIAGGAQKAFNLPAFLHSTGPLQPRRYLMTRWISLLACALAPAAIGCKGPAAKTEGPAPSSSVAAAEAAAPEAKTAAKRPARSRSASCILCREPWRSVRRPSRTWL